MCAIPSSRDVCVFLSRYGTALIGCGATCIRLEKNVSRIASAFGKSVEISVMPRHLYLTVSDSSDGTMFTSIATVPESALSFNVNTELSRLSWEISDGKIDYARIENRFESIIGSDRQNKWLLLMLVSIANASFCRLFGGDYIAMLIVGVAPFIGFYLKTMLQSRHIDSRIIVAVCAFVSSVLGSTADLFDLGSTPALAIGTSVLYLVPGIPFLNSFSDLIYRHYICAVSRFFDALVLMCCISTGLCAGMLLMDVGMF